MKNCITVFGATGGTGQKVIQQALEQGYKVKAFARTASKLKIEHPNLEMVSGNVLAYEEVLQSIDKEDIVICCLGMPASDKSSLRTKGTKNIVAAMKEKGAQRFICQTSLGFGDSKETLPWHMKYLIVPFILKNAFKDHELQEAVVEDSDLNWTIVRPGNMTNKGITRNYQHGFKASDPISLKISRADVAHFMLGQIINDAYSKMKVGISY